MRMLKKLIATTAMAVTATALTVAAMAPAMADPINGSGKPVAPKPADITGVGSDTIEFLLDQLSFDYNASHKTGSRLYSWDALNPRTGAMNDKIHEKAGCPAEPRPDGSGAGVLEATGGPLALTANLQITVKVKVNGKTKTEKFWCTDYARSSSPRSSADPPDSKGGIVFVALAKDAVTYATNSGSNAPANLTTGQLTKIYNCTFTNWKQVGGKNAPIDAQLPQTSSGTRKFFLTEIGLANPGPCVNSTAEENEGTDPVLKGANVIYPYSVGKWLAETFHSAKCFASSCKTNSKGVACTPSKTQNRFGCDNAGKMLLREINGKAPFVGTGKKAVINVKFSASFIRVVYAVVRWAPTKDNIPAYLEPFFASKRAKVKGFICSSKAGQQDLVNYGFLPTEFCGIGS